MIKPVAQRSYASLLLTFFVFFLLLFSRPTGCLALGVAPAVAAGNAHSVLLRADGTVWCWGANTYGQLGNGSTEASHTPRRVETLSGVVAVAAGANHSLALKEDGTVWAWGRNNQGQLGNNSNINSSVPLQVGTDGNYLTQVTAIAAGVGHSAALKEDGTVWCWGANLSGQLGEGTTTPSRIPVQVALTLGSTTYLQDVKSIAAGGYHTLAAKGDGTVWSWGANGSGQLGNGTTTSSSLPVQVVVSGIKLVAAGTNHSLALASNGGVWSWGANSSGQLGDGTTSAKNTAVAVALLNEVAAVAAGGDHSLALRSDASAWAWGLNNKGQLGDGTTSNRHARVQVKGPGGGVTVLSDVTTICGGYWHTLALLSGGNVWAWGDNSSGQLGDGSNLGKNLPVAAALPAPPAVNETMPAAGAAAVSTAAAVLVTFDQDIRAGLTFGQIALGDGAGNAVSSAVSLDRHTLSLVPHAALDYAASYTVSIPRWSLQGTPGNLLAEDISFSFTTEDAPDSTAPLVYSFTINEGAALTHSRHVLLKLDAWDDFTAREQLQLRFSDDGTAWSPWQEFIAAKAWTLPAGDGPKTVHLQVKDEAGNIGGSFALITLSTPPSDPDPANGSHTESDPDGGTAPYAAGQPQQASPLIFASLTLRLQPGSPAVSVNGRVLMLDFAPYIQAKSGRIMFPLRFFVESMGGSVYFLPHQQIIGFKMDGRELFLKIGSNRLTEGERQELMPSPVELVGGRTFVPLRFMGELFGFEVIWDYAGNGAVLKKRWYN